MRILFLVLSICFSSLCFADDKKPEIPPLPENVTLANGAILRDVSIVRWEKDFVVIKHRGGTDPIRFAHMSPECRAAFEANRASGLTTEAAKKKATTEAKAVAPKGQRFSGEVFIVTQGRGTYKLSGSTVVVYPLAAAQSGLSFRPPSLPDPLATITTDADGRFSVTIPFDQLPVMFRVLESRMVGKSQENYDWRISSETVADPAHVSLTNSNLYSLR